MLQFSGPGSFQITTPDPARYANQRRAPEDNAIPNGLRAAAEMLSLPSDTELHDGWTIDRLHMRLMGATGIAFDLWWPALETQRRGRRSDLELVFHADELRLGAAYLGFSAELVADHARRGICALTSLLDGWPFLALDLPDTDQWVLVTGYEDSGHTLIGYLAQPGGPGLTFTPQQQYRLPGGLTRARAFGLITGWAEPEPEPERIIGPLRRGAELLRRTSVGSYATGQACLAAWADLLEQAEASVIRDAGLGDPLIWELAERRWYASLFLALAAALLPDCAVPLLAAGACFQAEHDLMYEFNTTAGGSQPGDAQPLLVDDQARPKLAAIVRQAAAKDREAADLLDQAVAGL